jgi:CBS domain-containing protein
MNILFFLTPKTELAYVNTTHSVRQAIERMENHSYTAVPVLTTHGNYDSTITEGDLLWFMKQHPHLKFEDTKKIPLSLVARRTVIKTIDVESNIEDLLNLALGQNFVPVVDGRNLFIGIVRRYSILSFFKDQLSDALHKNIQQDER